MSLHPVVPVLLLLVAAALIVVFRVIELRRMTPTRRALWRWTGVSVAALLLVLAAARPVFGTEEGSLRVAGADDPNVFLLVDRSAGMAVRDAGGDRSRMTAARDDVAAVLDRYPDARVAVIAFASRPALDWPLSADVWSLRPELAALTPYRSTLDELRQANAAAASNVLRYQLISAKQQYPRAKNLVFYFGAGAVESRSSEREFTLPEGSVDGGSVFGYGTAAGGPVPGLDVESAIDEPALRGVAEQIGVPFVARNDIARNDDAPLPLPEAGPGADTAPVQAAPRAETYWLFAIAAAALLLVELYLVLREFRRTRSTSMEVLA